MFNLPKHIYDAAKYNLGDAVGGQLEAIGSGEPITDQNPNAVRMAAEWLERQMYGFETSLNEDTLNDLQSLLAHLQGEED